MWVKICANTSLEDALCAAELGADAVGFVFAPSKRQVTAAEVAQITRKLPEGLETVGVFCGTEETAIRAAALEAGVKSVQLHGTLDLALLARLAANDANGGSVTVIQALHWPVLQDDPAAPAAEIRREIAAIAELSARTGSEIRVLVDSKIGEATGGTGVPFDWSAAAGVFAEARAAGVPVILAGGLRPENVADAIARLAPWGVDVASGVEASPGRKDPGRLASFLARAHGAETP